MADRRLSPYEASATHLLLVLGCVLFAFPFAWMLMTSFKVVTEMDVERLRFLPRAPHPQPRTPYIDQTAFVDPGTPDEIPEPVWSAVRPRLVEALGQVLDRWQPHVVKAAADDTPAVSDMQAYRKIMIEGLMVNVQQRLSDPCRRKALDLARSQAPPGQSLSIVALTRSLTATQIASAGDAIVDEVSTLVDDTLLAQTFEACYRRVCVSVPRVRTSNYQVHDVGTEPEWRVEQGAVQLVTRHDGPALAQEARIDYTASPSERIALSTTPSLAGLDPAHIDRVLIRFRADSSWARVGLEVLFNGTRYRTTDRISFSDREWIEQELRFPGGEGSALDRRVYCMLHPIGPAPAGSPPLHIRMTVQKTGLPTAWADKLTNNYRYVFREVPYARYMMTSCALVILNILLAIGSCTLVGYSFARLQWPGRDLCFALLLATMMLPGQVTMIPSFLIIRALGWFNTLLPMWIPSAFGAPFFIFLFRQFFKNIPADLEDAARIDGCGFLRIYWHVMLPLVKPTIATVAIFTFMGTWNNFMGPLIYLNNEYLYPLALGLFKFNLRNGGNIGLMMAGALVMTLPIVSLFFFVQRFFIQGISLAGTKA